MKLFKKYNKFQTSILVFTTIWLTGCLPIPNTTLRAPEVQGHVFDAKTLAPLQGAKVSFFQSPHHTINTDADGYFDMKSTRNFHWAMVDGGGWPDGKDDIIEISHPGYVPYAFGAGAENGVKILLKPKP